LSKSVPGIILRVRDSRQYGAQARFTRVAGVAQFLGSAGAY
jgi:hypothetical protein